jgi:hypothetical protein
MTNTSLYVLTGEYLAVADRLADLDLDDQTVADTLEGLAGELEVKATNVAMFVRNLEASADAIKEAEGRMAARRKAIENRADRVRHYLQYNMETTGITKIESPYFKLAIRENPPSVVIDAESLIPAAFMRQPDPPPPSPDKKALAVALKAGEDIPGCHLGHSKRLEIK